MNKEVKMKVIVLIILLLGFLAYSGFAYINMVNEYEIKIENLSEENFELKEENEELSEEINNLSENIYNVFEKQPYEITIDHDGKTLVYSQDKFGIFSSFSKVVLY